MPTAKELLGPSTDYFICTLGEAIGLSADHGYVETVNSFIDHQAKAHAKDFAVGFPVPTGGWSYELFSFEDLRNGSLAIAKEISPIISKNTQTAGPDCIALLCPSSVDFLFAWLGLMRAGFSVLLIAPQCQPAAIAHLCKSCHASVLLHHKSYTSLANRVTWEFDSRVLPVQLPWQNLETSVTNIVRNFKMCFDVQIQNSVKPLDTAFIFHTSGTSTGLPKPIIQSHHAAVGVLPVLNGRQSATFTTTPLYHGGIADCFRAWTSGAPIWLFPASSIPITTQNIHLCLSVAAKAASERFVSPVNLFASVPYVLQMMSEDPAGLGSLQKMAIVGVGGAALIPKVGDYLVENGVNLVSRYGSAECGFLSASHRDYHTDKDWQYLRVSSHSKFLQFEEKADNPGLFELIVEKGWPHIAKTNREDGSFATGDLFEPHRTIKGAWKYHSRNDSQITLNTGKKFDPAPLEDLIASSSPLIQEAVIFGSGRQNPGILVFPCEGSNRDESEIEAEIWATINAINSKGQDHTRILRDMVVIASSREAILERSSKGTLLRGAVEKMFAGEIESAYSGQHEIPSQHLNMPFPDVEVKQMVRRTVNDVLGVDESLEDDKDFHVHGVDSATCTRIRSLLQKNISKQLPWNIIYDCGNINRLSQVLINLRVGKINPSMNKKSEMLELVERFSDLRFGDQAHRGEKRAIHAPYVVVLTGATGALGAHILDLLRRSPLTSQIICLVRAVDHFTARSRVSASLVKRKKPLLEISDPKVWCSPCKLHDQNLGLSEMELSHIRQSATHIIHAAWAVNFSLPLRSFVEEHIVGVYNLLNLTLSCSKAVQFNFCSSTASVLRPGRSFTIEEKVSSDPVDAGSIGYSRSKWVAEAICAAAATKLPGMVKILRIGQLTGDTKNGVWNVSEAWPLMLSTADALQCLPLIEESLSWLPLDTAATAITDVALQNTLGDQQPHVYHIVNNSSETTWSDLLAWSKETRPMPFDVVTPKVWLDRLESLTLKHAAKNLLGLWRDAYGNEETGRVPGQQDAKTVFSIIESQKESLAMQNVPPIDQALVAKIWNWLDEEISSAKSQVYVSRNRFACA